MTDTATTPATAPGAHAAAPPRRWYRKPLALIAASAVLLGGLAAGLILGLGLLGGPTGPAGVLAADGYPVTATFTKAQLSQLGMFAGDNAIAKSYVDSAALGVKGTQAELVVGLTDSGKTLIGTFLPLVQGNLDKGEHARMDGSNLVVNGPASVLSGSGGLGSLAPAAATAPAAPRQTAPAAPAPAVTQAPPAPQTVTQAPAGSPGMDLRDIGGGVYAGSATSTAFAQNVVAAWKHDPTAGVKQVYSPVTGQTYAMTYQLAGAGTVIATGGNGAYVQF